MADRTSPGVFPSVTDESIYSEPNPTTIPLFVIATRYDKTSSDGSSTARGTIEANKLRVVTSQRELNRNYGNAVFVTEDGEPVYDEETNEFGLLAAWSFLGRGSRAYIMRADIDLGGLVSTPNEPVLPPPDGTYWIDQDEVVGGIFRYDGSNWNAVDFHVFTSTPTASDGNDGDWCFDYTTMDGTIKYKEGGDWKPATADNISNDFAGASFTYGPSSPTTPSTGDFWYKITSSGGGTNLKLVRYRAVDGVFVTVPVHRQDNSPTPNEGTVWEDLSEFDTNAHRPLYVGTGSEFIPLEVYVQSSEPVTEPEDGTLWYDDDFTDFALYVEGTDHGRGNQWVPVQTTNVSNPTAQQKVISASAPFSPSEGAIWVDISTADNMDNFPVLKRWQGGTWIDITNDVEIGSDDPGASSVANGTYWLNTGESRTRNIVKRYNSDFTAYTVQANMNTNEYEVVEQTGNHWEPATGDEFGRKSQRGLIVEALQQAYVSNEEVRAESNYFQLIACPGYPELYDEMNALNSDNGETAFVVADTPKFMTPSGIPDGREITLAEWMTNARNVEVTGEEGFAASPSPYAGFWYPWCITTSPQGRDVFAPPSTMVMRTIAYSDSQAAPWFPPAGYTRGRVDNASSVGYLRSDGSYQPLQMTRSQRNIAYENNVNPIADIPNRGLVIYGQKTMSAVASALDRVNVARLVAKMKYDLQRLLEPFLFEINDPVTRRSAQVVTERYMAGLKSLRALYDYAVRCDESNNPPSTIDQYELYVDVAIKPAKAIEFIYVPITVLNTGDEFPF